MSSNTLDAYYTNDMFNAQNNYDVEKDLCEIEAEQYLISEMYYEIVGTHIEALEEKPNKDEKINKNRISCRKTSKAIKKLMNMKRNANKVKALSICGMDCCKKEDVKNDYIEIPFCKEYQGEWHNERLEVIAEQIAIPQQENNFQFENLLLQGQKDIIFTNKRVDQSINRNICQLNKNLKEFSSSSSSSLLSN